MKTCESCGKTGTLIPIQKQYSGRYKGRNFTKLARGYRCMECHESFIDHANDEEIDKEFTAFVQKVDAATHNRTCNNCRRASECPFAWDLYNVNGDCLADK